MIVAKTTVRLIGECNLLSVHEKRGRCRLIKALRGHGHEPLAMESLIQVTTSSSASQPMSSRDLSAVETRACPSAKAAIVVLTRDDVALTVYIPNSRR